MPTVYPKCSPTEMLGLLLLLGSHKGDEEIARLADDLDLEIDEILPSVDFAQLLGYLKVSDGRTALTEAGRKLLGATINARKELIRERLGRTTLFKALIRALESAPEHRLTEDEVIRLISFTTAPADELVQNIINWGRYAGMFRYDPDEHMLLPSRGRSPRVPTGGRPPPPSGPAGTGNADPASSKTSPPAPAPAEEAAPVAGRARRRVVAQTLMAPPTSPTSKGT